jgi:hypothetical protein
MKQVWRTLIILGVFAILAAAPAAHATLIVGTAASYSSYTVPGGFPAVPVAVDFTQYNYDGNFVAGPENILTSPITITFYSSDNSGVPPADGYLGGGYFGFEGGSPENGNWGYIGSNDPMRYSGLNFETGYMRYMFSAPVSAVGGFMNFDPFWARSNFVHVIALDIAGNPITGLDYIIGSDTIQLISTSGMQNWGAFIGIVSTSADIYGLELQNSYVALTDLRYDPVPVPPAIWLLGSGLLGLMGLRRKFNR